MCFHLIFQICFRCKSWCQLMKKVTQHGSPKHAHCNNAPLKNWTLPGLTLGELSDLYLSCIIYVLFTLWFAMYAKIWHWSWCCNILIFDITIYYVYWNIHRNIKSNIDLYLVPLLFNFQTRSVWGRSAYRKKRIFPSSKIAST